MCGKPHIMLFPDCGAEMGTQLGDATGPRTFASDGSPPSRDSAERYTDVTHIATCSLERQSPVAPRDEQRAETYVPINCSQRMLAITTPRANSLRGYRVSRGPVEFLPRMAGLNQAQLIGSGISSISTACKSGPTEGVNKNSSGTCWDVRTVANAKQLKEVLHILNKQVFLADSSTYVCLLQECIKSKDLKLGKKVHSHIIQSGFKPNTFLLNTLVNMHAKCGSMVDARNVFDKMCERDVFTWTTMMAGYVKHGCGGEAFQIYDSMRQERMMPNRVTFICILKACASLGALEKGKEVHADIIKAGIAPDVILETALVDMYAKCGNMKDAHQVFDNMAQQDVVSWNAMIRGYSHHGYGREGFEMYEKMIQEGVTPTKITFICVLNACASLAALDKGKEVHAHIIKSGIGLDVILETTLADMYAKCGNMKDACQLFNNMAQRSVVSWNVMIAGYGQHGRGREALAMYQQLVREGVIPDKVTFICTLNACASLEALEKGKEVHADISKSGVVPDIILENTLINMYAKCGSVKDARQVFGNIAERNVASWNVMITGYAQHGYGREAFEMYEQMMQEGVMPDKVTFICVLNVCASLAELEKGKGVHADCIQAGIAPDIILESALVDMYAKCGSLKDAREVFNNMAERNVVTWNAMITGYAQNGCGEEAFMMYERMIRERVMPDKVTFTCALNICASLADLEHGQEVYADILKAGIGLDIILETALVDMYAKCGRVKDAREVFDTMAQRNVVSWSVMIAGYTQIGCGQDALKMYEQMIQEGVTPDKVTFICVLNTCASLAALEKGQEVHADIIKAGIGPDSILETSLLDMYAKCGSIKDARQVFDNISKGDVVSWSSMIAGYGQHGCGREALQLFEQMQQEGLKPNSITFLGLLSACSHEGLVDEGRHYFNSMSCDHGLSPRMEHFSCMVGLLGRAGRLDEAEDFINKIPNEPCASVWGALLGACRIHGDVKLAERVAKCLIQLDPSACCSMSSAITYLFSFGQVDNHAKV